MNLFSPIRKFGWFDHHIKALLSSSLILIFALGCAEHISHLSKELNLWQGKSTDELFGLWGQPVATIKHSGEANLSYYDYAHMQRRTMDILLPTTRDNTTVLRHHPVMIGIKRHECRVTFFSTTAGIISHVEWQGLGHGCALFITSQPRAPA